MSVRSRIEQQERLALEEKLDYVPRAIQTAQQQAGAVSSTRSRQEQRAFESQPEEVVRNTGHLADGMSRADGINTSVRQRDMAQEYVASETRRPADPDALSANAWYQYEMNRQEQAKQCERDEQRRNQELIAKNAQQSKDRLQEKLLAICYADMGATDAERQHVNVLVRQNHPARFGEIDLHKLTLMKLRNALNGQD